jgi:hypothetical protein
MVQSWQYEEPQYWDTYVPQPEEYATTAEYEAALLAGSQDTSPKIGEYWDPIGQVWRGGKTTEQEQALVKFGNRDPSYNAGMGGAALRLNSSIGVNPDEARAAYMAYDEFGNPRIDPSVQALIEQQMGIGPYEPPPPTNMGGGADPRTGGRPLPPNMNDDTGIPDAQRHNNTWGPSSQPPSQTRSGGGGGMSQGLNTTPPDQPYDGPQLVYVDGRWVPSRQGSDFTPPPGMVNESNAATIDPRYPDWLMQYTQRLGGRRNTKWGPMPTGGLGQY